MAYHVAYANMRGNIPRRRKIYAIFWDHHRAWFPEKNSTAQKHIQIDSMLRSGFFSPQNTLGDGPAFWIFFQDSRIMVKNREVQAVSDSPVSGSRNFKNFNQSKDRLEFAFEIATWSNATTRRSGQENTSDKNCEKYSTIRERYERCINRNYSIWWYFQ